jgi:hypothetical protein
MVSGRTHQRVRVRSWSRSLAALAIVGACCFQLRRLRDAPPTARLTAAPLAALSPQPRLPADDHCASPRGDHGEEEEADHATTRRPPATAAPAAAAPPRVVVSGPHNLALAHWLDAVDARVLPRRGVRLLHFDSHSDLAPSDERPAALPRGMRWPFALAGENWLFAKVRAFHHDGFDRSLVAHAPRERALRRGPRGRRRPLLMRHAIGRPRASRTGAPRRGPRPLRIRRSVVVVCGFCVAAPNEIAPTGPLYRCFKTTS